MYKIVIGFSKFFQKNRINQKLRNAVIPTWDLPNLYIAYLEKP